MESLRTQILETIVSKSSLKQTIFDNTFTSLSMLKETLFEMASELDDELDGQLDRRVRLEYRDRGKFEAQLQVASDMLIFQMRTDVFRFDSDHAIWQNPYVLESPRNGYCGVINIYNFLSDSFKFNRNADEGYLIGRIFINADSHYFVEGKEQKSMRVDSFGSEPLCRSALVAILESAVNYAINFDLLVPSFENNKRVKLDQFNNKIDNSKFETGKLLDFEYVIDDIWQGEKE
ncbi:MAG: hypothetical protein SNH13_01890 [Rikenellaceae bacterium]